MDTMIICEFEIVGTSPLSFSAPIQSLKNTGEGNDAFEERTWRERLRVNAEGNGIITPMAIKNCLSECAKYLSESVPGKGKATYTKHFEAGVLVTEPLVVIQSDGSTVTRKDVKPNRLFVPASGKRGDGKRVWRTFPIIQDGWTAKGSLYAMDPVLADKPDKIAEYLGHAGKFIGIGTFRPRNNGYFGRFIVKSFKSQQMKDAA